MTVETRKIKVNSNSDADIIDITGLVESEVNKSKIKNGIVNIFISGSTASVSTIEFEPNLVSDFKNAIERIVPSNIKYKHTETWGDDNGKSHVRATLMGPSLTVPFNDKKLLLGQWQQLVVCDWDVPARNREIILQIVGD